MLPYYLMNSRKESGTMIFFSSETVMVEWVVFGAYKMNRGPNWRRPTVQNKPNVTLDRKVSQILMEVRFIQS